MYVNWLEIRSPRHQTVEYGSFSITTQFTTKIDGLFGGYPVPTGPPQEMEKKGILVGIK